MTDKPPKLPKPKPPMGKQALKLDTQFRLAQIAWENRPYDSA